MTSLVQASTTLTEESIVSFQRSLTARGRAALTVKAYSSDLRTFLAEMELTSVPILSLETTSQDWLNTTREIMAPRTTLRRLSSIRAFGKWSGVRILEDYIAPDPGKAYAHPLPEGIEGVRRMVCGLANARYRALVGLCGFCGLRVTEARMVTPADIDVAAGLLTVRGKGDKTRTVPLSADAFGAVAQALLQSGWTQTLVQLSDRGARYIITEHGANTLGHLVASHDLRMTFGCAVHEKYGLRAAQELLGHASANTTEGYTTVPLETLRKAVEL